VSHRELPRFCGGEQDRSNDMQHVHRALFLFNIIKISNGTCASLHCASIRNRMYVRVEDSHDPRISCPRERTFKRTIHGNWHLRERVTETSGIRDRCLLHSTVINGIGIPDYICFLLPRLVVFSLLRLPRSIVNLFRNMRQGGILILTKKQVEQQARGHFQDSRAISSKRRETR